MIAIEYKPLEAKDGFDEVTNDKAESDAIEYKPLEAKDGFDEVTNDKAESDANPFAAASTKAVATTEDALGV